MPIVGIGSEIVECVRIGRLLDQFGIAFLNRVYTDREVQECQARIRPVEHYAARWAAKEAVLRAIGLGPGSGLARTWIEIRQESAAKSDVRLRGPAAEHAASRGIAKVLVSLAHCRSYATAHALAVSSAHTPPPV
ncbi:MAG: holo-[acyl-carrier-protein] synthase [Isosphaeraceae bacterium]|jgi:holo-[acyl-carrier protein] synthase|nr:MAG: holo-[acyl-carrier-protein] synthase [Isosphaeraceae bacterium]